MNGVFRPEAAERADTAIGESETAARAFWQLRGMARTVGVDMTGALGSGRLDRTELRAMVLTCSLCRHRLPCTAFLARNGAGVAGVPGYCPLGTTFERIRGDAG